MIIEASSTKPKAQNGEDYSRYQQMAASSLLNLSKVTERQPSPLLVSQAERNGQHSDVDEDEEDEEEEEEVERVQERSSENATEEASRAISRPISEEAGAKEQDEEEEDEVDEDEPAELADRPKESDHQYFSEEVQSEHPEDQPKVEEEGLEEGEVRGMEPNQTREEEEDDYEDEDDEEEESCGERVERGEFITQGRPNIITSSHIARSTPESRSNGHGDLEERENYITHGASPLHVPVLRKASSSPMVIEVRSEGSERDEDDGDDEAEDDDSLSQRSAITDNESEMYDMTRGNLGLLEQAIALKAEQVRVPRGPLGARLPDHHHHHHHQQQQQQHHRYFTFDERPSGKHLDGLRKNYFSKGSK